MSTQLDAQGCVNCRIWSVLVLTWSPTPRIKWMKTVFDGSALSTNQLKDSIAWVGRGALNMVAVLSIVQQGNWRVLVGSEPLIASRFRYGNANRSGKGLLFPPIFL